MTNFEKIREFHKAFRYAGHSEVERTPPLDTRLLRKKLIAEEFSELLDVLMNEPENHEQIAKEGADLLVVVYGLFHDYGINADEAFALVHESNMSKLDDDGNPVFREDGKILKSKNYLPPDMKKCLTVAND